MNEGRWFTLLRENLDKLFLLVLIGLFTAMHLFRGAVDPTTQSWGRDQITLVIGTLLGLVGGPVARSLITGSKPPAPPENFPLPPPRDKV